MGNRHYLYWHDMSAQQPLYDAQEGHHYMELYCK
jgi:hypothetical protein